MLGIASSSAPVFMQAACHLVQEGCQSKALQVLVQRLPKGLVLSCMADEDLVLPAQGRSCSADSQHFRTMHTLHVQVEC
jgi:hypothetical protein